MRSRGALCLLHILLPASLAESVHKGVENTAFDQLLLSRPASDQFLPIHYPPALTTINNLTYVIHGKGAPGVFNSSITPDASYSDAYNWCSMPHVRTKEYPLPSSEYELQYVEVIHRHHKRTPYASNTFFHEAVLWDCDDSGPLSYGKNVSDPLTPITPISWSRMRDSANPMSANFGPGFVNSSCQFPQITSEGLADSYQHGLDLASVYRDLLHFLPDEPLADEVSFRVTNNVITSQVLGALVAGLFPQKSNAIHVKALIQSSNYDSLEPSYSCPAAKAIKDRILSSDNPDWMAHLEQSTTLMTKLDSVSGMARDDTAGWHSSYDHYYDNLSAKLCHQTPLPCSVNDTSHCITEAESNTVFRLGNYEYSLLWRDSPESARYAGLHFGAWIFELKSHFEGVIHHSNSMKYRHNVAHDGSLSSLLSFLQVEKMVWPGMGSEVVFEIWKERPPGDLFLRVLWGGQPLSTSTPLKVLDMIDLNTFIEYLDSQLPADLRAACEDPFPTL